MEGHKDSVETLRSYGASMKLSDNYGRAPASLARENGHLARLEAKLSKYLELENAANY